MLNNNNLGLFKVFNLIKILSLQTTIRKGKYETTISIYEQALIQILYAFEKERTSAFSVKWSNKNNQYFETCQNLNLAIPQIISWLKWFPNQILSIEMLFENGIKINSNSVDETFIDIPSTIDIDKFLEKIKVTCSPNYSHDVDLPSVPHLLKTIEI